jgi:pimeloyl-ACP methyl ester carboxylesterase
LTSNTASLSGLRRVRERLGPTALVVAVLATLAIAVSLWRLFGATAGLTVTHTRAGLVPVTVYRPSSAAPAPVVVIAHGFAGSQQLMEPFAVTLARNGYLAVTFDFPGHGRNPEPFVARIEDQERRVRILTGALDAVADFALKQPGGDGRLALLGHSMAGDVLLRYAALHRDQVSATVLLSPYISGDAPTREPRNLLLVYGALEPEMLQRMGRAAIAAETGVAAKPGVTYGQLANGSARRLVLAGGVEHIGILYSESSLNAALDWLNQAFHRSGSGFIDKPGPWLGLLYLGIVALAYTLARLLPRAATEPLGAGLSWRHLLPVALVPAILTPVILRLVPTHFLPILVGDYLALHFGVYGLLTAVGILYVNRGIPAPNPGRTLWPGLIIGTLAACTYATLALALPTDRFVTSFMPTPERLLLLLAILPGTWIYFAADGWLTQGTAAPRGAAAVTKLLFLLSLLLAVALDLRELFFILIIVPAILVFFLVYGLMGSWVYRRTRHPLVGALANGLAFAWAIAVTFPVFSP